MIDRKIIISGQIDDCPKNLGKKLEDNFGINSFDFIEIDSFLQIDFAVEKDVLCIFCFPEYDYDLLIKISRISQSNIPLIIITKQETIRIFPDIGKLSQADLVLCSAIPNDIIFDNIISYSNLYFHNRELTRINESVSKRSNLIEDNVNQPIIQVNSELCVVNWNNAAQGLFGYSEHAAVGKNFSKIFVNDINFDEIISDLLNYINSNDRSFLSKIYKLQGLANSGKRFPVSLRVTELNNKRKQLILVVTDLSTKITANEILVQREKAMELILDNVPAIVFQWYARKDGSRGFNYLNGKCQEILKYEPEELIRDWTLLRVHSDEQDHFLSSIDKAVENQEPWKYEGRMIRRDGKIIWFSAFSSPIRSGNNEILFHGLILDISDKKESQKILLESEEKLKQALADRDRFLSIIAHDIKSPVGSFRDASNLLLESFDSIDDGEKLEFIQLLSENSQNLYELLDQLLFWSGSKRGVIDFDPKKFKLDDAVENVFSKLKQNANTKDISLVKNYNKQIEVIADKSMLETILRNLISNGIKFTKPGGFVKVGAENSNYYVKFTVCDSGTGIPEEKLENLFNLSGIQSTPGTNKEIGTGFGLRLCKELVDKHQGEISARNLPEGGAAFEIIFPQ